MSRKNRRPRTGLIVVIGLATLLLSQLLPQATVIQPTARRKVAQALQSANDSGQFAYQTTVVQTMHPVLSLDNVGRTAQTTHFTIDGEMDMPAERMVMELTQANQQPIQIKIEDGRGYGRVSDDEAWSDVDVVSDLLSPGSDPLGFLAAVENVRMVDGNSAENNSPADLLPVSYMQSVTRYQYDLDSLQYAQMMREQMEEMLRESGELPAGLSLQTARRYVEMTGKGEIWISHDLPVRQILHVQFPAEDGADHWVSAEITTTFTDWAEPTHELLADNWFQDPLGTANALFVNWLPTEPCYKNALANRQCLFYSTVVKIGVEKRKEVG